MSRWIKRLALLTVFAILPVTALQAEPADLLINVALGKATSASRVYGADVPGKAVDGSTTTLWNSGGGPTQWIEIDLGEEIPVSGVRLHVAQTPAGTTTHQVTGRTAGGANVALWTWSGYSYDDALLANLDLATAVPVRYVRVTTTASPSWVAWREIEVLAYSAVPSASTAWSRIKALYR